MPYIVLNTYCMTIKLWAMPLVYPVLLGYMPLLWGTMSWCDMHVVAMSTIVGIEPTPTIHDPPCIPLH